jgi:uncharacterized protein (TIGR02271 family)
MATDVMTKTQTLAATFHDVEQAREAAKYLKAAGFDKCWIGISKQSQEDDSYQAVPLQDAVEDANWFQRLFGEENESLHNVLIRHGVDPTDAHAAGVLGIHAAVLTVNGSNHPEEAAQILTTCGGKLITNGFGATGYRTNGEHQLFDEDVSRRDQNARQDYGRFRSGETLEASQRMQLREERLRVEADRRQSGEAQVGKRIVEKQQEFDVPVSHEELFIQRRPLSGKVNRPGGIGDEQEIVRVPLSAERLQINKETIATEEVVIGKRSVNEIQHVSEKIRKEVLDINNTDR